jgi:hypothetical protein
VFLWLSKNEATHTGSSGLGGFLPAYAEIANAGRLLRRISPNQKPLQISYSQWLNKTLLHDQL